MLSHLLCQRHFQWQTQNSEQVSCGRMRALYNLLPWWPNKKKKKEKKFRGLAAQPSRKVIITTQQPANTSVTRVCVFVFLSDSFTRHACQKGRALIPHAWQTPGAETTPGNLQTGRLFVRSFARRPPSPRPKQHDSFCHKFHRLRFFLLARKHGNRNWLGSRGAILAWSLFNTRDQSTAYRAQEGRKRGVTKARARQQPAASLR